MGKRKTKWADKPGSVCLLYTSTVDVAQRHVSIKNNPGRHNMLNACASLIVASVLGLDVDAAAASLSTFDGVRRRFTHVGDTRGVCVVDDYGHHPTEVGATLKAAKTLDFKHVVVAVSSTHLAVYKRQVSMRAHRASL